MLEEDREPAVVRWFRAAIADLPGPMRHELGVWFDVMRNGSATPPRSRPRSDTTADSQLRWALPALRQWAVQHQSLREIGRDDVLAVLPPSGAPRACMRQGLRSIFGILKGRKLVFVNPAARISAPQPARQAPAAVDLEALRAALDSADPARAALAALLAFHAVRIYQLCALRLTDLRDGRLYVGGQVILLAGPVRQRLARYLDFRQQTWPDSVNPYLFLHVRNAGAARHVTPQWIRKQLGMSGQRIRLDRIFDEAQATGGDLRALCDLFGLSVAGAYRYASVLDRVESPTSASPGSRRDGARASDELRGDRSTDLWWGRAGRGTAGNLWSHRRSAPGNSPGIRQFARAVRAGARTARKRTRRGSTPGRRIQVCRTATKHLREGAPGCGRSIPGPARPECRRRKLAVGPRSGNRSRITRGSRSG